MSKILTSEEMANKYKNTYYSVFSQNYYTDDVKKACVEFAKQHVKAALEAASKQAVLLLYTEQPFIDKDSILKSYPEENVK